MSTVNAVAKTPCEYCGTPLDEEGREENYADTGPSQWSTHLVANCRERLSAAHRAEKRAHMACRGALKRAALTLGDFGVAIEHPIWEVLEEVGIL